jgi:hypothetical protein
MCAHREDVGDVVWVPHSHGSLSLTLVIHYI